MPLRDYQIRARAAVLAAFKEYRSVLVVMPTGVGKTILFADIIKCFFPRRSIVAAHRQELIWQAKDKIYQTTKLSTDVEMGEYKAIASGGLFKKAIATVTTIQTLTAGNDGGGRIGKFDPLEFGLLIIDEAHHATSPSYRKVIEYFCSNENLRVLGVTATPDRADEEALGQVFDTVAFDYEILDAIHDGWLVPIEQQIVYAEPIDLSSVRTTAGDLNGADLAAVMESEKALHSVAGPTIEIAGDKRTLAFTASVAQAQQLAEILNRHKRNSAAWVCGKTDPSERMQINNDFNCGKIQYLCNCGTHTEGFDSPAVEIIVQAKPTKSRALYAQMIGRSTRPLPGVVDGPDNANARRAAIAASAKPSCLVIDFVGNSGKHKLVTVADILGGNVSDAAIEATATMARTMGRPVRVDKALDEQQAEIEEREKRRIEQEARRAALITKTTYSRQSVDPFDVLQIQPIKSRGWHQGKQLSEKQRGFLRKQGLNPDTMEYGRASQLIGEMLGRFDKHLCTLKQATTLKKFGYLGACNMTFEAASAAIDSLAKNGWRRPAARNRPIPPRPSAQPQPAFAGDMDDNVPF